jgi:glucokinase
MSTSLVIGIDIGGTSTKFGIVDTRGSILYQSSIITCETADPLDFIARLTKELSIQIEKFGGVPNFAGIGIGAPNGNYHSGAVEFAPNLKWKGKVELVRLIEDRLNIKTVLTNDANAAALGEMMYGNAVGMKNFLLFTLGTGLGCGVVVNGELVYGHTGFAGELGHMIVEPHGRECGCGRLGCLETYASATGIVKTVFELMDKTDMESSLRELGPTEITAKQITEAALQGDEIALSAYLYTADILARALANAVVFTSPEAIFLFGGLTQAKDLLFNPTKKFFEQNLLNIFQNSVKLLPSGLPESDAAILGAAAVATK